MYSVDVLYPIENTDKKLSQDLSEPKGSAILSEISAKLTEVKDALEESKTETETEIESEENENE